MRLKSLAFTFLTPLDFLPRLNSGEVLAVIAAAQCGGKSRSLPLCTFPPLVHLFPFCFSPRFSTSQLILPPSTSPPRAWLDVIQYVTFYTTWPPAPSLHLNHFHLKFAQISAEFCFCLNFVMARRSFFDQFLFPRKSNKVLLTLQLFSLPHRHWS